MKSFYLQTLLELLSKSLQRSKRSKCKFSINFKEAKFLSISLASSLEHTKFRASINEFSNNLQVKSSK